MTDVFQLNGKGGLESWRWYELVEFITESRCLLLTLNRVFIIEGALPVVMAAPIYFLLLTFPENSTALSERGRCSGIRYKNNADRMETERHIAINRFDEVPHE